MTIEIDKRSSFFIMIKVLVNNLSRTNLDIFSGMIRSCFQKIDELHS